MEADLLTFATQFGTAGLIAWMWLAERRAAGQRDAQLREAHEQMRTQRVQLESVLTVVSESARATAALEASQRRLAEAVDDLARSLRERGAASADEHVDREHGDRRAGAA